MKQILSEKMRITAGSSKIVRFSERQVSFYMKYTSIVVKTLRKPSFQRFLRWILTRENMHEDRVENIHIMIFPFQKKNGRGLAGRCNSKGEIYIFPKRLGLCRKLKSELGKEKILCYIRKRAKAALIHELLHLKYSCDEKKVRRLTREYLEMFDPEFRVKDDDAKMRQRVRR